MNKVGSFQLLIIAFYFKDSEYSEGFIDFAIVFFSVNTFKGNKNDNYM